MPAALHRRALLAALTLTPALELLGPLGADLSGVALVLLGQDALAALELGLRERFDAGRLGGVLVGSGPASSTASFALVPLALAPKLAGAAGSALPRVGAGELRAIVVAAGGVDTSILAIPMPRARAA